MKYTVYKITNTINNKIYIGVHKTNNLDDGYMGSGLAINRAIEKYGVNNFIKEYLHIFDTSEEMFDMEAELVNEPFVENKDTYNIKLGGCGGFDHINKNRYIHWSSKEYSEMGIKGTDKQKWLRENNKEWKKQTSKNISDAQKVRYETKSGTKSFLGKSHSKETKKKMSDSHKGKHKGENNSQFGTMWIHNLDLKQSKKIKKDDFPTWKQEGWLKGRKMKF